MCHIVGHSIVLVLETDLRAFENGHSGGHVNRLGKGDTERYRNRLEGLRMGGIRERETWNFNKKVESNILRHNLINNDVNSKVGKAGRAVGLFLGRCLETL